VQEWSNAGYFGYGSNLDGHEVEAGASNKVAGYWFGLFYVLFYLSDTFTNIPYEALGPELHSDTGVRPSAYVTRLLVTLGHSSVPSLILRNRDSSFRSQSWTVSLRHRLHCSGSVCVPTEAC
jgi:hypothetical protein